MERSNANLTVSSAMSERLPNYTLGWLLIELSVLGFFLTLAKLKVWWECEYTFYSAINRRLNVYSVTLPFLIIIFTLYNAHEPLEVGR